VVDPAAIELTYWDTIKNSNNPNDFKSYLDKYPDGQFAELAKSRSQPKAVNNSGNGDAASLEVTYWNAIKDSRNPSDFRAYTTKFPNGLFVELANSRISVLESETRERDRARLAAEEADRLKNTHMFELKDESGTDGTLTVAPGVVSFEVKKRSEKNDRKNIVIQCSEIKRIEVGKSQYQPPHVNISLTPQNGKARELSYFTSSGGQGFFVKTPVVDVTSEVINSVIEACRMVRMNK
jgi:hypothetical protein